MHRPDRRAEKIAKQALRLVGSGGAVLEVGAGSGTNLAALCRAGFRNIACVEVDQQLCLGMRENMPTCEVFCGTLAEYTRVTERQKGYDLILLSHVLEHFVQPQVALRLLHSLLKPSGQLMILVPNADEQERFMRQFTTPHTHYLTPSTLELLLRHCGFNKTLELSDEQGEIFLCCEKCEPMPVGWHSAAEYSRQVMRARKDRRREWLRHLGKQVLERTLTEKQARSLHGKLQRVRRRLRCAKDC